MGAARTAGSTSAGEAIATLSSSNEDGCLLLPTLQPLPRLDAILMEPARNHRRPEHALQISCFQVWPLLLKTRGQVRDLPAPLAHSQAPLGKNMRYPRQTGPEQVSQNRSTVILWLSSAGWICAHLHAGPAPGQSDPARRARSVDLSSGAEPDLKDRARPRVPDRQGSGGAPAHQESGYRQVSCEELRCGGPNQRGGRSNSGYHGCRLEMDHQVGTIFEYSWLGAAQTVSFGHSQSCP
jgi:hypothetical protein